MLAVSLFYVPVEFGDHSQTNVYRISSVNVVCWTLILSVRRFLQISIDLIFYRFSNPCISSVILSPIRNKSNYHRLYEIGLIQTLFY